MTAFKVGDKVKVIEGMWTDISLIKYGFNKDEYEIVSTVFGEGTYSSLNFYGKKGRYDAAYFELVEEEKVKNKFAKGDKVISVIDHPNIPEGFIGHITHITEKWGYTVQNDKGTSGCFEKNELELLSSSKQVSPDAPKPDVINSPKHYAVFEQVEAIQVIASSMTQEQFYGYCLGNILKYRLRAGGKDDVMQELGKADKYQELYTEHKHLCKEGK